MSDLRDDLLDIPNVGEATADEIEAVVAAHDGAQGDVAAHLESALDYYDDGRYEYAGKFLRRAYEATE